ncbi:hypothetical protein C6N75_10920 [Streptomyces solincola]|uniref:Secreted protein n=1 Tax=Streptomyces solincola TaxID=2100817 RepID=A0A2S9PXP6_9ACTN|nr:hypothetical protein [Streptomyces solincola]PRH79179.1 hypothetical protein C6N75_10920 [Streptomyces solincola]
MPRGRHRHSPPLHRLLPPSAVAGAAVLSAAVAWLPTDPLVLRLLAAAAAVSAVAGAVLTRTWDRAAGRRVAELTRARAGDQWRSEERVAELESDLEESRELRGKLDAKLRTKRIELAALRNEHAELLRRYATAETERASALEGRRQLALEVAAPGGVTAAGRPALPVSPSTPTQGAYLQAARALAELTRNATMQQARRTLAAAAPRPGVPAAGVPAVKGAAPFGEHGASAAQGDGPGGDGPGGGPGGGMTPVPPAAAIPPPGPRRSVQRLQGGFDFFGTGPGPDGDGDPDSARDRSAAPATHDGDDAPHADDAPHMDGAAPANDAASANGAASVNGAAPVRAALGRGTGGRQGADSRVTDAAASPAGAGSAPSTAAGPVGEDEDLADVVGEEALAHHQARRATERRAVGEVIDLTAHDETEQIDLAGLRRNAAG